MRYRRSNAAGGTFFFTINLAARSAALLTQHITALRAVTRHVRQHHPFEIVAMVVLPEHLHTIWTLPGNDSDYPMRWSLIKGGFSRAMPKGERINDARRRKRERGIWQHRYWEHQIRDDDDLQRHVDCIHGNPVKHGYVVRAVDWPYSSIHRYIRAGILTENWAGDFAGQEADFGEAE